jgi:hypothetical protein
MELRAEISYPTATCEQAWAMLVDPDFRTAVCEATHALDYDVAIEEDDAGGARVVVDRTMPADVPDMMKKFIGETVGVVQTERWGPPAADGSRTADLTLEVKGQPAKLTGSLTLQPDGDGCRELVEGDLTVSIPFFGKKIEPEIAKGIHAAVRAEEKTGQSRLS